VNLYGNVVLAGGTTMFHDTSSQHVMLCDVFFCVNLYANVVVPSGTTMFQELAERMTKKPTDLSPLTM